MGRERKRDAKKDQDAKSRFSLDKRVCGAKKRERNGRRCFFVFIAEIGSRRAREGSALWPKNWFRGSLRLVPILIFAVISISVLIRRLCFCGIMKTSQRA